MSDGRRGVAIATRTAATAVILAVLVFAVDLFAGPFFYVFQKTWPPERRGAASIGAIESAIKGTDSAAATVHLASGFLGVTSTPVVVTPDTRILIGGKIGGFGDLDRRQIVRVAYEVFPDRLVARRIEVLDDIDFDPPPPAPSGAEPAAIPGPLARDPAVTARRPPRAPAPPRPSQEDGRAAVDWLFKPSP